MCKLQDIDERLSSLSVDLFSIIESFEELNPGYNRDLGLSESKEIDLLLSRSLLILGHAELESFFEGLATDLLDLSLITWETNGSINYNLGALLFSSSYKKGNEENFKIIPKKAIATYKQNVLEKNHGIKKSNLKNLYEPIGYNLEKVKNQDIRQLFFTLDTLGGKRGESAHHNQGSIHNPLSFPDVVTIFEEDIIEKLEPFINFLKEPLSNES